MALRIYTDESVSVAVASGLRRRGVTAISARDAGNLRLTDEEQLVYASSQRMVLFTHDEDFLKLAGQFMVAQRDHWGIVYVHQDKLSLGECIYRLYELAEIAEPADLLNRVQYL
jgi:hypothetical protein